ncbi:Rrf2 family transcriptional regulator [Halioxenophilus aromaticivorans]|uniref:Nitric oxide-sensing transcriptional repressor NsrR n=1 Tax=Halioxenophilus aromaticivorans TaxID=1306992 RepID=A0AAV3TZG4_9ALTE
MQLTKHTDYAFRTLIFLAANPDRLCNIQEVAKAFTLSKSHLMKIVNQMVHAGWVESLRGKNGGIRLAQQPQDINVADVVSQMEQTLAPVNCEDPPCVISPQCVLKSVLWQAQREFMQHLRQYTLADVITDPTVQILQIEPLNESQEDDKTQASEKAQKADMVEGN